jgi:biofilm PGA synthesis N-glycosyltransferase PgaC
VTLKTNSESSMSYVLITPAKNEETTIDATLRSVISQTILPIRWVIVSDGSTDHTDDIVKKYVNDYSWIQYIRTPERKERHFAGKVIAFNAGYDKVQDLAYDIIGNLDADITFDKDYFEYLLDRFSQNPRLGVAGTPFVEDGKHYDFRYASVEHVSGACQMFRKPCFEEIGGYIPIKGGGIDWTAVTTARMKGWQTRTFTEKTCIHHRKIGTGDSGTLMAFYKYGQKNYFLGGHPLWHLFRSFFQMTHKPYIIGGMLLLWGYVWAFISRTKRPISPELVRFYRTEQMQRLKNIFRKIIKLAPGK